MLKNIKKAIIAITVMTVIGFTSFGAHAQMTKGEIEKIIHDYLMSHGDVILQSVDQYQQQAEENRYKGVVQDNQSELFEDERNPFIGNVKGDVILIEFFDYNCGYCKRAYDSVEALVKEDKNLKIVFKEFPILSPSSVEAAKWALAAHEQQKFHAMHEKLMKHRGGLDDETIQKIAKEVGLDMDRAKKDAESEVVLIQIQKNKALATKMGISGTPAFIIGKDVIPGAVPKEALQEKIKELRAEKKK